MKTQVIERLSEPSTYAGLAMLAALAGIGADDWQNYVNALAAVFAVVAMAVREGPKQTGTKTSPPPRFD